MTDLHWHVMIRTIPPQFKMNEEIPLQFDLQVYPRRRLVRHQWPPKGLECHMWHDPCCVVIPPSTRHGSVRGHGGSHHQLEILQCLDHEQVAVITCCWRPHSAEIWNHVEPGIGIGEDLIEQPTLKRTLKPMIPAVQHKHWSFSFLGSNLPDVPWQLSIAGIVCPHLSIADPSPPPSLSLLLLTTKAPCCWGLIGMINQIPSCLIHRCWGR